MHSSVLRGYDFKLTANGGRPELERNISRNKKKVFEGFCVFARQAKSFSAPLTFLSNIESGQQVSIYLSDAAGKTIKLAQSKLTDFT